jgi:hypothetical protein
VIWAICRGHQLRDAHADDVGQAVWLHLAGHLDSLRDPAPLGGLAGNHPPGNDTGGAIVSLLAVENQARSRGSRWCPATRSTTSHRG